MSPTAPKSPEPTGAVSETLEAPAAAPSGAEQGSDSPDPLQDLLDRVADGPAAELEAAQAALPAVALPAGVSLRTAEPVSIRGRVVTIRCHGMEGEILVELGRGVAQELVAQAVRNGDALLVESAPGAAPRCVGVLHTRLPGELTLRARKVHIEADEELLLRAGRGAVRIRQDGEIEIVGSRIAAFSRGLFRLVGRMLRLN